MGTLSVKLYPVPITNGIWIDLLYRTGKIDSGEWVGAVKVNQVLILAFTPKSMHSQMNLNEENEII